MQTVVAAKAKWKSLELPLSGTIVNKTQHRNSGGIVELSATIKDLKDAETVAPTTLPFHSPIWPVQKIDGAWRMIVS